VMNSKFHPKHIWKNDRGCMWLVLSIVFISFSLLVFIFFVFLRFRLPMIHSLRPCPVMLISVSYAGIFFSPSLIMFFFARLLYS
jgi:hypothetical protein